MQIYLNGEERPIVSPTTIEDLLIQLDIAEKRVAIEVNEQIIPRGEHKATFLQAGDKVEVIHAIAGG